MPMIQLFRRSALTSGRPRDMKPMQVPGTLAAHLIEGRAVWTRAADFRAKTWREKSDAFVIMLRVGEVAVEPLTYYTGAGHRWVAGTSYFAGGPESCDPKRAKRLQLSARGGYSLFDIEHSQPAVPAVGDVLGCIYSDAAIYAEHRDEAEPLGALADSGLVEINSAADMAEARRIWEGCRAQWHRLQSIFNAGVSEAELVNILEEEGCL